jgi:hypothetical protein
MTASSLQPDEDFLNNPVNLLVFWCFGVLVSEI